MFVLCKTHITERDAKARDVRARQQRVVDRVQETIALHEETLEQHYRKYRFTQTLIDEMVGVMGGIHDHATDQIYVGGCCFCAQDILLGYTTREDVFERILSVNPDFFKKTHMRLPHHGLQRDEIFI